MVPKTSPLLEDLPGDIDGVGLRLEKARLNSIQTKTFSPILSARKGWSWRGTIDVDFIGLCHLTDVRFVPNPRIRTWTLKRNGAIIEKTHMNTLVKQDGENAEAGNL